MSAPLLQTVPPPAVAISSAPSLNQGSFRPHPPEIADFGRKPDQMAGPGSANAILDNRSQTVPAVTVAIQPPDGELLDPDQKGAEVFDQRHPAAGRNPPPLPAAIQEGLALIDEARPPRNLGGRPTAIDDVAKIKIATLMATGASLRQVAGFLGVSHTTVSAAIAADPALKQEIDAARQRALLHPLACIVRESGRNWKAAAWLMGYLNKQASQELPADDRNRQAAEEQAALGIQCDLAGEIRQQARLDRERQKRREEDEQWRQEIAARKARELARAQRKASADIARTTPPPPASSS